MKTWVTLGAVVLTGVFLFLLMGQNQDVETPSPKAAVSSQERLVDTGKLYAPLQSAAPKQNNAHASETKKSDSDTASFDKYQIAQAQSAVYEFMLRVDIAKKYQINAFTCHESYCRIEAVTREKHSFASVSDFLAKINEDEGIVGKDSAYRVALVSVQPADGFVSYEMELGDAHRYALPPELDEATKILKEAFRLERELKK